MLSLRCESGLDNLIIEEKFADVVAWACGKKNPPWQWIHIVRDLRRLCSRTLIQFRHVRKSTNCVVDFLAKIGVDRVVPHVEWLSPLCRM